MIRWSQELKRAGQQIAALLLILAFALQGISAAVAAGQLAASAAQGQLGMELCLHSASADRDGAAQPPGAPGTRTSDCCIFCLAGTSAVLEGWAEPLQFYKVAHAINPWLFTTLRLQRLTVSVSSGPRGPPANG